MAEIVLSESAWNDLDSISDYITQDLIRYAEEFSIRLFSRIEKLVDYPNLGRMVPEFNNQDLRELIFGKYRIGYRVRLDKIVVIRIVLGSKLISRF